MKKLIKSIFAFIVVLILVAYLTLSFFSKPLIISVFSKILKTEVTISSVKFAPLTLDLSLSKISIPEKKITFHKGTIHLIPLKLNLKGLDIKKDISILDDKIILQVWSENIFKQEWGLKINIKDLNLMDLYSLWPQSKSYSVPGGVLGGMIEGDYTEGICNIYGVLSFMDIRFDDSTGKENNKIFGISMEDIKEFADDNNGTLDFDFYYTGPVSELNNPFRFRPGDKTIEFLSACLIKKIL